MCVLVVPALVPCSRRCRGFFTLFSVYNCIIHFLVFISIGKQQIKTLFSVFFLRCHISTDTAPWTVAGWAFPGSGGPGTPAPGWRVGRCAACFFSLIFLMLFCFPGSFGDVVSRCQQLRQRAPCGGYGAGGEGWVSGVNSPEK